MENIPSAKNTPGPRQLEGKIVYTVSSINNRIGEDLTSDSMLSDVWIEGEVYGLKPHPSSGHCYGTLKDGSSEIGCMAFRNTASNIPALKSISDGALVLARGDITTYSPRGTYSFRIKDLRIIGRGDLFILFEELKKKLEGEGLFDTARKRPIPRFPMTIGVVTSESGAALQDILNIIKRRNPLARILLSPALVQGETAPTSIIRAMETLDKSGRVELIIVGRGGGSMEDLWCFNNEGLARTIASCSVPVVSAVGHETDFTIADFVADMRAPTPSAAAELVTPDMLEITKWLADASRRLQTTMAGIIEQENYELQSLEDRLESRNPRGIIEQGHTRLDDLETRLMNRMRIIVEQLLKDTNAWDERLENAAPPAVVKRGYALVTDGKGHLLTNIDTVKTGMEVEIEMSNGKIKATITGVKKDEG